METCALLASLFELGEGLGYGCASNMAWWVDVRGRPLLDHRFETGQTLS